MSPKSPLQAKKKGFTMPHTFVILMIIILIAVALTWVIPSGSYARVEDPLSGKKVVYATSFSYVENVHVSLLDVPMLIIKAFSANADLITLILLSGGAIHMLTATGALQALVATIVRKFSSRVEIFIPLLMLVFGLIERQFPLTAAIPGVKLGLANSVLLYSLYMLGIRQSFVLMLLKALMSWLIYTNMNAMFYSLGGGLLSLVVMILVSRMKGVSVIGVSALGAVFFNVGQILVAVLMLNTPQLLVTYLPILMISGVVTGVLTGIVAQMVMKHLKTIGGKM